MMRPDPESGRIRPLEKMQAEKMSFRE